MPWRLQAAQLPAISRAWTFPQPLPALRGGMSRPYASGSGSSPWLPPGTSTFWVCRHCGGINPRTSTTCRRCGR